MKSGRIKKRIRIGTGRWLLAIIAPLLLLSLAFSLTWQDSEHAAIERYAAGDLHKIQLSARLIESRMIQTLQRLGKLAKDPDVIAMTESGKDKIRISYIEEADWMSSITRVTPDMHIQYTTPVESAIGADLSGQPHNRLIANEHIEVISSPFTTVQGFEAIAVCVPMFNDIDEYVGCITMLINFENFIHDVYIADNEYDQTSFIVDTSGTVLSHTDAEVVGQDSAVVYGNNPSVQVLLTQSHPADEYPIELTGDWSTSSSGTVGDGVGVSTTLRLSEDMHWMIYRLRSRQAILADTPVPVVPFIAAGIAVLLIAGFSGFWLILSFRHQDRLEHEIEARQESDERVFALNEELIATNAELTSANVELGVINEELEERVTERTAELNSTNAQIMAILEAMPDHMFEIDRHGIFRDCWSPGEAKLLAPFEEIVGSPIATILPAHVAAATTTAISNTLATGQMQVFEYTINVAGRKIIEEARMVKSGKEEVLVIVRNITDRKQAETELRKVQNYISNIIDSMPSLLVGVDADGLITQWNSEAQHSTGIQPDTAIGQPLSKALPHMAPRIKRVHEAIQTGNVWTGSRQERKTNGETIYEDVIIYPLTANGAAGAVIRIDDVTERVRIEELMVQSEKMMSVGGLAAGMAHEINNPLGGMMQTASVMGDRLTNMELPANKRAAAEAGTTVEAINTYMKARKVTDMLERIRKSGVRAAKIVDNMLSFARKGDTLCSAHDVADLLDRTVELASSDYDLARKYDFRRIEIVRKYEADLPLLPCESGKIQQVLLNILRNGAEAMQENIGEAGELIDGNSPRFILLLAHEKDAGMIRIEIADNGTGMPEDVRRRVFEPFFTTKPTDRGTGLGLSVSYFIITENHKGKMSVESHAGEGTTFTIRLPVEKNGND